MVTFTKADLSDAVLKDMLDAVPYAKFLGMDANIMGDELTTMLPFNDHLIGNPVLPAIHGGVMGAFLEMTAIIQLSAELDSASMPKTVDITVDYLRSGKPLTLFGRADVTKHGRRVANVRAIAWQEEKERPVAALHGHFLIRPKNDDN